MPHPQRAEPPGARLPATSPGVRRGGLAHLAFAIPLLAFAHASATPRIPPSDDTVLQHVPAAAATRALEPLRRRLAADPRDLPTALALAQEYLSLGRDAADPRFVSYAQATLTPWLASAHPSAEVLTLDASALQYLHRFDEALRQLDRAIAVQPLSGQAWLTKATILQVQGHFEAARQACRPLVRSGGQLIALACLTSVNSMTGQLTSSYAALRGIFRDDARLPLGIRLWIFELLGDMAERAGDDRAAEEYLDQALRAAPGDGYAKAQYADLLLREHRNAEVVKLLRNETSQDNLLLRLSIAATRLRDPSAGQWSDEFQARFETARRAGDTTHLREQARFVLEVRGRAAQALDLARHNWEVQKEPADVRVYVQAARASAGPHATAEVGEWIRRNGYEDHTIDAPAAFLAELPPR